MLDRKFIAENADRVKENCARGVNCDGRCRLGSSAWSRPARQKQQEVDELNRQANEVSQDRSARPKTPPSAKPRKEEGRRLRELNEAAQAELDQLDCRGATPFSGRFPICRIPTRRRRRPMKRTCEIRRGNAMSRASSTSSRSTMSSLGEQLDLIDFEAGAKVAGHGFYFLKNDAVLLELALQRYAIDLLMDEGFTPTITPDLARNEILQGIGFNPRGPETQIYSIENSDLSLVATAEITLGGLFAERDSRSRATADQALRHQPLLSHRGRRWRPRGTRVVSRAPVHQGRDVRLHAARGTATRCTSIFCDLECEIFDGLGIPYRVIDTATGDLGGPAYRKFDLEAWMPGRGDGGEYGEVTSASNCTDYQSRRLDIRYRKKGEKGTHFVHTLNGTAVAISRAIIAILENYQQADGSRRGAGTFEEMGR